MNELLTIKNIGPAFVLAINILCAIHIIMHKHEEPVSAVLWLAYIVIFPHGTGVPFYLIFGINRLKIHGPKVELASNKIKRLHSVPSGSLYSYLHASAKFETSLAEKETYSHILNRALPETPLMQGNSVKLLNDGIEAYPAMLEAIQNATDHIHLCSYILLYDKEGKEIMSALRKKAEEGVKVKVIFDRIGSDPFSNALKVKRLDRKHPNLEVKPFAMLDLLAPYRVQLRNHRKLMLVDGRIGFVGGINISAENMLSSGPNAIHDLHCRIEGPVVGQLQYIFLRDWCYVAHRDPNRVFNENNYFPTPELKGENSLRTCASGPGQSHEATHKVFLTAANAAKESLWIMTPYFVPDQAFIAALKVAAARDIDIRIIVPAKSDHWLVQSAARSYYDTLLKEGIRIYERNGCFNHSKAMLVDRKWSFMGSSNCDGRSFRLNYELDFVCEDGPFNEDLYSQLSLEIANSREIKLEKHKARSVFTQFKENLSSLFTPVL